MKSPSTDKKFYRIREVSEIVGVPQSTLRFWESQFTQLTPKRNDKGTRYYTPEHLETVKMLKYMLHDKGLHIEAARQQLKVNRDGITRHAVAIDRLGQVRDRLQQLIDSLHHLR